MATSMSMPMPASAVVRRPYSFVDVRESSSVRRALHFAQRAVFKDKPVKTDTLIAFNDATSEIGTLGSSSKTG
jgi:hypothetical protein